MYRFKTKEFIKALSVKHNIPIHKIEEVIQSEFEFVKKVIREADLLENTFKSVFLPTLGRFTPSIKRRRLLHDKAKQKQQKYLDDLSRYEVFRTFDNLSEETEGDTPATIQNEDTVAG